jgi:uncharacterized membrane protein
VLFVTARRASTRDARERMAWTIAGVVTILAVVITHHVTSYALVAALAGVTAIVSFRNRRRVRVTAPWDLLIVAFVGSMAWLLTVASPTLVYLGSVFGPAIAQTVSALLAGRPIRGLFQATPGAVATPLWQQLVGLIWVVLLVVGIIWGLIQARGRTLSTTFAPVLLVAAAIYVPLQGLRLTQAGWETANRSSEFLFVGVALVLALAALTILTSRRYELRQRIAALTGCGVLLVLGAIITGWTYQLQLPPPYLVIASDGRSVEPEGVIDARWALQMLGPGNVIATDQSNALFMATYGRQLTYTGQERGVQGLFFAPTADASVLDVLRTAQPQYVVFDQRLRSWDHLVGVFPPGGAGPLGPPSPLLDPATLAKFDAMDGVSRIADSGNIVVFDMRQETDALSR